MLIAINNQHKRDVNTNHRCKSPVNNISTQSLIPATRVSRDRYLFTVATQKFFYAVYERSVIHCAEMRVPPLEIAFAQMTRRSVLVGVGAKNFLIRLQITESNYNVPRRDASTCLFSSVFFRERLHVYPWETLTQLIFLLLRVDPTCVYEKKDMST